MAKSDEAPGFWGEMFRVDLYKRNQGRIARQLTAVAIVGIVAFGAWTLSATVLSSYDKAVRTLIPAGVVALAAWFAFRVVNYPRFADFLISVQAEMDKVSWPSKQELYRATIVVLVVMFLLGAVLFAYDLFWVWLFQTLHVLNPS